MHGSLTCSNGAMDDGNLADDLPDWWPYPVQCGHGHPWSPGHVIVSYVRCPCRADEGISAHTVVRCTTDGCRSAWYRPRHYPPGAAPSRDTGVSDPRTWLGDRACRREHNTVGSQVGSHRQSTQDDSESNEVPITGI